MGMDRFGFDDRKVRPDAIVAYLVGVVLAYLLQIQLRLGGGALLTTLIIAVTGGAWYHWRKIL